MKLPVLALQLLVENIFKHNYLSEKNPLKFSIVTYENSLIVYNEKKSVKLTEKNNTGLKNLNTRYQLICNKNIQIIDTHDQFKVIIPLLNS
jgi:LytS/YehU family sensor histidine kinase